MDALLGGPGDDQLTGGGGADGLGGGDGNDTIQSRDGEVDGVSCGDGADTALVDWLDDTTKSGCETLKLGDTDPPARYGVTIGKRVAVPNKHTGFGDRYVMNVKVGCPRKARGGCAGQFKLCRDAGCQDKIRLYAVKVRAGRTQVVSQRLESTLSTYAGQLAKKHRATMWGVAVVRDSAGHTRSTFTKLSLRASR
jgi:hypothetical protein